MEMTQKIETVYTFEEWEKEFYKRRKQEYKRKNWKKIRIRKLHLITQKVIALVIFLLGMLEMQLNNAIIGMIIVCIGSYFLTTYKDYIEAFKK